MNLAKLGWTFGAAVVAAGCGSTAPSASDGPAATTASALTGGGVDDTDSVVGLVWRTDTGEQCTGTLIGPYIVLTAAHCVDDPGTDPVSAVAASDVLFYTGVGQGSRLPYSGPIPGPYADTSMAAHAVNAIKLATGFVIGPDGGCPNTNDAALLLLDRPAAYAGAGFYPTATSGTQEPSVSVEVTAIGYGTDLDTDTFGIRMSATEATTVVAADTITAVPAASAPASGPSPGVADNGDSGGPLLYGGVIVAVDMCSTEPGTYAEYSRIDVVAPWIASTASAWVSAREAECSTTCEAAEQQCFGQGENICVCVNEEASCYQLCAGGGPAPPECRDPIVF